MKLLLLLITFSVGALGYHAWRARELRPFLLVMKRKDDILSTLLASFSKGSGKCWSISGIGAIENPTIAYYNLQTKQYEKKQYEGIFEIASLNGNISFFQEKPIAHVHVVLGTQNHEAIAGHLVEGSVGVTLELTVVPLAKPRTRSFDQETGLNLFTQK